ncbi:hypothetical protein Salat_1136200 [Sesamum alatum]|uniref:Uncharacterized protein n=1 Tax=Sesamum alatum TaxID=300844 RepID=A0AAE1YDP8_9LAMI|nr:hypothetical protein Salat_1136200 [Sesamum alatum]
MTQSEASRLAVEEKSLVVEEKIKQLEKNLEDQAFRSQVELETTRTVAMESSKTEGFSAGRAAGKKEDLIAGREAYLSSTEHQKLISDTRLQGAHDFLKSSAFQAVVEIKAFRDANLK